MMCLTGVFFGLLTVVLLGVGALGLYGYCWNRRKP